MGGTSTKPKLSLITQPQEYFRELVTDSMGRQNVSATPETEVYLVNLLNQFMTTDRLYRRDENGNPKEEPLALMLKDALEESNPQGQRALFRQVGDVSLYMAGFFQDSLARKVVDVDYYIGMGGGAYRQVAARVDENTMRALYAELGEKFASFVEVFADVSERTQGVPKSEADLLRLYELWVRTRSDRAARALQEAGIIPNASLKKNWQ
jgi:hypothetical protein